MMAYQLGAKIEIRTVLDDLISGVIFAYSHNNKVVVVQTRPGDTSSDGDFRVVNTSFIKRTRTLENTRVKPVEPANSAKKTQQAESLYKIAVSNPLASSIARKIFKHLLDYFSYDQIKWKGDDIEIRNEVRICHPYSLHNIKGDSKSETTEIVATALQKFWLAQASSDKGG